MASFAQVHLQSPIRSSVLFPQARNHTPLVCKKQKMDFFTTVLRRGTKEDGRTHTLSTDTTESADSEDFDNLNQECRSPITKSPDVRPSKVEGIELQLEHSTRSQVGSGRWNQAMLLVCATVHASHLWHFAAVAMTNGSTAFLLIYVLMLSLVAVPFGVMELGLGQYTSLPVCVIFKRIAPIATGVGHFLLVLRLFNSLLLALQPRFLIYFYNFMLTTLTNDAKWLSCESYPNATCLAHVCKSDQVWMEDDHGIVRCVDMYSPQFARLPLGSMMSIFKQSESTISFSPSHIFMLETTFTADVALLLTDVVILSMAGIIAYYGNKLFGKLAPILVFCSVIGLVVISVYCFLDITDKGDYTPILAALSPQWHMLANYETWLNCALQVLTTIGFGDGTLLTLGSYADFNNDIPSEVTIMAFFGSAIRILATITAILMMSASKQAAAIGLDVFRELGADGESFWLRLPFTLLPALAKDSMSHRICCNIFYLSMVISLLGFQVVTIEMFLSTIYRVCSPLIHLPGKSTRYWLVCIVVSVMSLLLGISYQFEFAIIDDYFYKTYYLEALAVLYMYQITAFVALYGARRLLINIETMSGHHYHSRRIAVVVKATWFVWVFILPCFMLALIAASDIHKKYYSITTSTIHVSLLVAIPLVVGVYLATMTVCEGHRIYHLLHTHPKWGPLNVKNNRRAVNDEMAARIFT